MSKLTDLERERGRKCLKAVEEADGAEEYDHACAGLQRWLSHSAASLLEDSTSLAEIEAKGGTVANVMQEGYNALEVEFHSLGHKWRAAKDLAEKRLKRVDKLERGGIKRDRKLWKKKKALTQARERLRKFEKMEGYWKSLLTDDDCWCEGGGVFVADKCGEDDCSHTLKNGDDCPIERYCTCRLGIVMERDALVEKVKVLEAKSVHVNENWHAAEEEVNRLRGVVRNWEGSNNGGSQEFPF